MSKNPEIKVVPEQLKNDKDIVKVAVKTGGPAVIKLEDGSYAYIDKDGKIIKIIDPSQQESKEPVEETENEQV